MGLDRLAFNRWNMRIAVMNNILENKKKCAVRRFNNSNLLLQVDHKCIKDIMELEHFKYFIFISNI